jgi:HK97 family phage major capsid protein
MRRSPRLSWRKLTLPREPVKPKANPLSVDPVASCSRSIGMTAAVLTFVASTAGEIRTRDAEPDDDLRYLNFEVDRATIDKTARTVQLSFSSEAPVDRGFEIEILDHAPGSVRLGRLNNGGALLMDHNRTDQVGVVESATIDAKTKKGRAVVRFSKAQRPEEIFQDVQDGIRRLVSVGYRIHKWVTESKADGVETVRVTDWEPFEISIVSIPADDSVGVGRGATSPANNPLTPSNFLTSMNREQMIAALRAAGIAFRDEMTDDQLRALLPAGAPGATVPPAPAPPPGNGQRAADPSPVPGTVPGMTTGREAPQFTAADHERAMTAERARVADIGVLASQARAQGITVDDNNAVRSGMSTDQFRAQIYESLISRGAGFTPGPPSRSEARDLDRFSMARGIQLLATGRQLDGVEREMHEEAHLEAQRFGLNLTGQFSVPMAVLSHGRRDMTATGGTNGDQGGNTIVTTQGAYIELLYNKLVLRGLGTQFLSNLSGNFSLPKMLTGTAPAKATENGALGESSPTTGLVNFSPKRAGRFVEYSKQLIAQSPLAWEPILRNDLTSQLAVMMEIAAINGGGTDEPTGLLNTAGIGSVAGGANGLALTRGNAIKLKTAVATSNADAGSLGFLTNPAVRGKAQETPIDAGSGLFLWKEDRDDWFMGYQAGVTNSVPGNLVKGTSGTVCSAMAFGNWADSVFCQWGGIDFTINPYIKDTEGLIRITGDCFYDFGIRRAASFAAIKDLLTA